jgi:radical SAM superfamily enzyme YgiQ (UPF0313 family)
MKQFTGKAQVVLAAVHLEPGPEAVPLGAASVAAALKAAIPGLVVRLTGTCVKDGVEALARKIRAAIPDDGSGPVAAGFSLYSWNRETMVRAAALLRKERPLWFLFCGGPEASALPGGLSQTEGGPFDAVIAGEGEAGAVQALGKWLNSDSNAAANTASENGGPFAAGDFAAYPSPWLDGTLDAAKREGVLWELARGCPYSCAYCYESIGLRFDESMGLFKSHGSKRVRYTGEERLLAELRAFLRARVPYVFVLDPTFNADDKRAIRVLGLIETETQKALTGVQTQWHFEVRAERLTGEQARRFARIGASLQIGLQTAGSKTAALIGRDFNRGHFMSGINRLNREGVIFGLDLIYGLPGDSLAGFKRSLDFALSLYPNNLDLFPLAVLPGTVLHERSAELGLDASKTAPYEVISSPDFPAADLSKAKRLCEAADVFYNQGRAVAWFNQVLYPLKVKPSAFLEGFSKHLETKLHDSSVPNSIEVQQLNYLSQQYRKANKTALLPAVQDIVRYHGAWGRALAENAITVINFNYEPDEVLGEAAMDLQSFAAAAVKQPVTVRVGPGKGGVEMRRLNRR